MDQHQFDALVRHLSVQKTRREGLGVLLTGLAAGALGLPAASEAADCKGKGQACENNEDCCSRICRFSGFGDEQREDGQGDRVSSQRVTAARRGKKGKRRRNCRKGGKGRVGAERRNNCKGGKKGACDCSRLKGRCNTAADCCFADQACAANGCEEHTVCCKKTGDPCEDDCDCCGERSFCDEDGRCADCGEKKLTQEPCARDEDCCFDGEVCASIFATCEGRQGDRQCCAPGDAACEETCDCCSPLFCDPDLGRCVAPGSLCPPDEVACLIANPKKTCCPEDFPHCCDESKPFGCCAAGFPVCCDHTKVIVVEGETFEIGCCREDQVCCPEAADILCADSLAECGVV
jgi:hypothetical protein